MRFLVRLFPYACLVAVLFMVAMGLGTLLLPRAAGAQTTVVDLTPEERAWIKANPVIRHVAIPDYPPVESYETDGRAVGIAPDYLAEAVSRLGMQVETIHVPNWRAALDSIRTGTADLITAIQKTDSRSRFMVFTEPVLSVPDVILVREQVEGMLTMDDLSGQTVAVIDKYAANSFLRTEYPDVTYRPVANVGTALEKVALGSVDALVLSLPVASATIEQSQLPNLRVAGKTGYVYTLRFGVPNDRRMLATVLDKALGSLTASTHSAIYNRWVSLQPPTTANDRDLWTFILLFGGAIVLLGVGAAWNWSLHREVRRRTDELREAKQNAEEMNRLKSAFLANMNHEFRTPLTSIIGFSDALLDKPLDDPAKQFLRHINENGRRLHHALESILHLSQLEAGSVSLGAQRLALRTEVEQVVETFFEQATQQNLTLRIMPGGERVHAHADPAAVQRTLSILLSNAIKFTEAGGTITVRVRENEMDAIVDVSDTGVGIAPDFIPKLYEAFEQESWGENREFEGVGLGLAIARRLTQMMGGRIELESEKGRGTRFTVQLPRFQPATVHPTRNGVETAAS